MGQAVYGFVYLPNALYAHQPQRMGKGAVIRGDYHLTALGEGGNAAAGGAHAGIHHRHEYCACGPVADGLYKAIAAFPNIVGLYVVGKVKQPEGRVNAFGNAVHGAYRAVAQAKIALKYKRLHISTPPLRLQFIMM